MPIIRQEPLRRPVTRNRPYAGGTRALFQAPSRYGLAFVIGLALGATAPPPAGAVDGDLLGLGDAKFGMTIEQVQSALGPAARIVKDEGGDYVNGDAQLGQLTLSASYMFTNSQLSAIFLEPKNDEAGDCHDLAADLFKRLERRFGPSDSGLQSVAKIVEHDMDANFINLSAATFSFANGGQIALVYYSVSDGLNYLCDGVVEFARSKNDATVAADKLGDLIDQIDSENWERFGPGVP